MGSFEKTIVNMFKKDVLDELQYYALEIMADRGYLPDSVERTEDEILLHVDEEEETGAEIITLDRKSRTLKEYVEDFIDVKIDAPRYDYDKSFSEPDLPARGTAPIAQHEARIGGGEYAILPGTKVNWTALKNWVRTVKVHSDPILLDARIDTNKFERLVDGTAYKVARKIWYVGRKPASTTPEEWDMSTQGMRPADGTYSPGKEFWEKGFPYGANYQYRTGMFS